MKVISSWSGGKDSCLACYNAMQDGLDVSYLMNMAVNGRSHGLDMKLVSAQSQSIGIPLMQRVVTWNTYEEEFKNSVDELIRDLRSRSSEGNALRLKKKGVDGMVFGDIDLQEHRDWVENICAELGVKAFLPLWKRDRIEILNEFISAGFEAVVVCVRSDVLDREWLGRVVNEEFVKDLSHTGIDLCGEFGEYHTFVVDGPIFKKKIKILKSSEVERDGKWFLDVLDYEIK